MGKFLDLILDLFDNMIFPLLASEVLLIEVFGFSLDIAITPVINHQHSQFTPKL